jgi:hypothetical protein
MVCVVLACGVVIGWACAKKQARARELRKISFFIRRIILRVKNKGIETVDFINAGLAVVLKMK